jgi:hypothetical protein
MDTTQDLIKKANAMVAQTQAEGSTPFATSTFNTSTTVPGEILTQPTQGLQFPPTPQPQDMSAIMGSIPTLQQITQQLNQTSQAEQNVTSTQERLADIFGRLSGKSSRQAELEAQSGLPQFQTQLTDINNQIQTLQKEAMSQQLTSENRLAPMFAIRGEQAEIQRASTVKALGLSAIAQTLQGNIANAQSLADRAVQLEFEPLEMELAFTRELYNINKDVLEREDKKKANLLNIQLAERERLLQEQKEERKEIQNLAISAISKGNAPASVLEQLAGKSTEEAINLLAPYLKTQNTDVVRLENGNTLLIDTNSGQIIKNFGGAKPKEVTGITNPIVAQTFGTLINTAANLEGTVSGKEIVRTQLADLLGRGDYASAYNQIANTVANGLVGETKNRFENARIDREVLTGFKTALESYRDDGGDMGLLKGTAEQISRKLGRVKDPALASIAVQLEREFQTYRNVMTGAAFTPAESREYESVNPTSKKSLDLNIAVIDGALNQLNNRVDGTIRAKVPQVADIQKLLTTKIQTQDAKQQVNTFYKTATPQVKTTIESLISTGKYDDKAILDYLKIKGLIK